MVEKLSNKNINKINHLQTIFILLKKKLAIILKYVIIYSEGG